MFDNFKAGPACLGYVEFFINVSGVPSLAQVLVYHASGLLQLLCYLRHALFLALRHFLQHCPLGFCKVVAQLLQFVCDICYFHRFLSPNFIFTALINFEYSFLSYKEFISRTEAIWPLIASSMSVRMR